MNKIEVDNHDWNEDQTWRLQRFASQILTLGLVECGAVPEISALFDVPWPKLVALSLHECGPVDGVIRKLYASPIEHLELAVRGDPGVDRRAVVRVAPDVATHDALADLGMPELRVLEIDCYELELVTGDLEKLIDREQRPTLATLELRGVTLIGDLPQRDGLEIRIT